MPLFADADTGDLTHRLQQDVLHLPGKIRLDGEFLVWEAAQAKPSADGAYTGETAPGFMEPRVWADPSLLRRFLALADNAAPRQFLSFAKRYGVFYRDCLGTWPSEGLYRRNPLVTGRTQRVVIDEVDGEEIRITLDELRGRHDQWEQRGSRIRGRYGRGREPLEGWCDYAGRFAAVLRIANALHSEEIPPHEDWRALLLSPGSLTHTLDSHLLLLERVPTFESHKYSLALELDAWLELAGVRPRLHWDDPDAPTLVFGGGGLFGALVFMLASLVAHTRAWAICSACGELFYLTKTDRSARRRPRTGEAHYCEKENCKKRAAAKHSRAYRQRVSEARRLRAEGLSVEQIAEHLKLPGGGRLGDPVQRVREWLESADGPRR